MVISTIPGLSIIPSFAHKNRAGRVKIAPAAKDSPAEPTVCTMLLSKIEFLRMITRITPMAITAAGIEADTVIPTRNPKYAFAAPNITAKRIPMKIDVNVISGVILSAGIYGLKFFCSFIILSISLYFALSDVISNILPQIAPNSNVFAPSLIVKFFINIAKYFFLHDIHILQVIFHIAEHISFLSCHVCLVFPFCKHFCQFPQWFR